ncbi:MAG: mucoidy inhibitor MuiA family protein [Melioribacteraceae bacterium]|nr:mucoidy inhibitor MuiA family protein [Melioribacteraceae bacterium]
MIKRIVVLLVFGLVFLNISANEIPAKTNLTKVIVFLGGAELTHTANVEVPKGVSELVLSNVADNIVKNSLQVGGEGDFVILSVTSRKNYLTPSERSPRLAELEDSLKLLKRETTQLKNDKQVLQYELDLLLANKNFGSSEKGLTVLELQKMSDYFNKKSTQLLKEITEIDLKSERVNKRISKIQNQINEISGRLKNEINEIVVTVSANNNSTGKIKVTYITHDAGWNPSYDLRAANINSPVNLEMRANVWQRTGIDWDDMNIILSTRSARQNNNKPELRRWFVDFVKERMLSGRGTNEIQLMKSAAAPQMDAAAEAESAADYMMVQETQLAVEYQPEINYSIPSDGKPHIVPLQKYELDAEYEYYAAPKLVSNAFLVANVEGWEEFNLLPGSANIYFENSYVGNSFINPNSTEDKMTFSLGRDESIVIKREMLKDFTEDKFFGSDVERFFGYEISVRNTKSKEINLTLEDQIPISKNEDIEVELIEKGDAAINKNDGILSWKIKLNPGESITKKFTFSVRHPEDKPINIY